jgi:hypothetical protein
VSGNKGSDDDDDSKRTFFWAVTKEQMECGGGNGRSRSCLTGTEYGVVAVLFIVHEEFFDRESRCYSLGFFRRSSSPPLLNGRSDWTSERSLDDSNNQTKAPSVAAAAVAEAAAAAAAAGIISSQPFRKGARSLARSLARSKGGKYS